MKTYDLKKGKQYYYTAGAEWEKVTYKHETINGYLFTSADKDNILTKQDIELNIEEI